MGELTSVDIVIPVYNEEEMLESSISKLNSFMGKNAKFNYKIIIADNGSIDKTQEIGKKLQKRLAKTAYVRLDFKGRGRALRTVWTKSKADIVCYMDVDLSTDINYFPKMIGEMVQGEYDVAFGSRHLKDSIVVRGFKREVLSRSYNWLLRNIAGAKFYDAQCGFKAVTKQAKETLLPLIENNTWFFDSELLLVAQRNRMRLLEFPVKWVDNPDSRVKIVPTVKDYLMNIWRMRGSR